MRFDFRLVLAPLFLASFAAAQGADDCANPTVVTGVGTFAFNTATASSTGIPSNCGTFHRDVWFRWTAPATQAYTVSTCGSAAFDTRLAVSPGTGCPADLGLACNDDACSAQSSLAFAATAGATYTIRIGSWSPAIGGAGTFTIAGGGCPATAAGPDLVVATIDAAQNETPTGTLDALSLGNTVCNVGGDVADAHAGDAMRALLGTALYRYEVVDGASRFEQVGLGWLEPTFTVANANACCTCTDPLSNQVLGVGCSHTHTAGQMALQSGLVPRSDFSTDNFAIQYPPSNPPYSGTTARRIEVDLADGRVTAPGGPRFFGETHLFAFDDRSALNYGNNSSWVEVGCTGTASDWTFAVAGSTTSGQAALRAWAQLDPTVQYVEVDDYGAGYYVLASDVTNLGDGTWRYEYAVHVVTGSRGVQSFGVPIELGVTLTNIGFHDVTYRNGDGVGGVNRSSVDWPAKLELGSITWATEEYGQDPNANALLWGSTYNFRFDANAAPVTGYSATTYMWRSGFWPYLSFPARVPGPSSAVNQPFCAGDGSGFDCPCANAGGPERGCASSVSVVGARLAASGTPSIANDTLVLAGTEMPNSQALYFQGTLPWTAEHSAPFGDGLRCVGGAIVRLRIVPIAGGASQYPMAGDLPISIRGSNTAGTTRYYQAWYRNAANFCTAATFNTTNGLRVFWWP